MLKTIWTKPLKVTTTKKTRSIEEAAEDAEFESEDEDEEGGEADPNDEDFSEEWSEVPLQRKKSPEKVRKLVLHRAGSGGGRHPWRWRRSTSAV